VTLVDTGPLVALCDSHDSLHRRAVTHLQRLVGQELHICEAVLVETCFHLPHAAQRRRLRALLEEFGFGFISATSDHTFWMDVFDWLAKYANHEPDWADACLAVLSGRHPKATVWTYDREFRTIWRRLDGSTVPMAVRS
jgi:predicted nucleic acid-binding protein